jgi:hypothetical protein
MVPCVRSEYRSPVLSVCYSCCRLFWFSWPPLMLWLIVIVMTINALSITVSVYFLLSTGPSTGIHAIFLCESHPCSTPDPGILRNNVDGAGRGLEWQPWSGSHLASLLHHPYPYLTLYTDCWSDTCLVSNVVCKAE